MKSFKRPTAVAVIGMSILTLSACTPSTGTNASITDDPFGAAQAPQSAPATQQAPAAAEETPKLRQADGTLSILIDDEAALPQALLNDFTELTGVSVQAGRFDPSQGNVTVDVFVGFDEHAIEGANKGSLLSQSAPVDIRVEQPVNAIPAALAYGRDDACLLMDRQWAALNNQTIPVSLAAASQLASLIVLAPEQSDTKHAFADFAQSALGVGYLEWNTKLTAGALSPTNWEEAAQASTVRLVEQPGTREVPGRPIWAANATGPFPSSSDEGGTRPLQIAPVSLIGRAVPNTARESYFSVVPGSCAKRTLYLAASAAVNNSDATEAFLEYMLSSRAQKILARTGSAIPLEAQNAAGSLFEELMKE